ncbi:phosphatidylserine decarboxylase proenzyme, mitochondrial isoform X2 [Stigmatopora argus]
MWNSSADGWQNSSSPASVWVLPKDSFSNALAKNMAAVLVWLTLSVINGSMRLLRQPALHHVHRHGDQRRAPAESGDGALRAKLRLPQDPRVRLLPAVPEGRAAAASDVSWSRLRVKLQKGKKRRWRLPLPATPAAPPAGDGRRLLRLPALQEARGWRRARSGHARSGGPLSLLPDTAVVPGVGTRQPGGAPHLAPQTRLLALHLDLWSQHAGSGGGGLESLPKSRGVFPSAAEGVGAAALLRLLPGVSGGRQDCAPWSCAGFGGGASQRGDVQPGALPGPARRDSRSQSGRQSRNQSRSHSPVLPGRPPVQPRQRAVSRGGLPGSGGLPPLPLPRRLDGGAQTALPRFADVGEPGRGGPRQGVVLPERARGPERPMAARLLLLHRRGRHQRGIHTRLL